MNRTKTLLAATAAAGLLAVAGCSSTQDSSAGADPPSASSSSSAGAQSASPSSPSSPSSSSAGSGSPSPSSSPDSAESAVITIEDFDYSGASSVAPGTEITVKNADSTAHTLTADDDSSLFDVTVAPGESKTFTAPDKAGTFPYHCNFHSNMHGTLKVS